MSQEPFNYKNPLKKDTFIYKRLFEQTSPLHTIPSLLYKNSISLDILQEASFFTFFALLGTSIFENTLLEHLSLSKKYYNYSLAFIHKNKEKQESLWTYFWENVLAFDNLEHSFHIPVLSFQYFSTEIPSIITQASISNKDFIHLLSSIETFAMENSLCTADLGSLYESLISLSLVHNEDNSFYFTENISQKTSASYYTPSLLSEFLVKESIDNCTEKLCDITILDNSCGTGNILLHALRYLTEKIFLKRESTFLSTIESSLNNVEKEKYLYTYIKRYCIEHSLYGIDTNPFALSICQYILSIEGFIPFEKPLPIYKTIKLGNALLGINYSTALSLTSSAKDKDTLSSLFIQFTKALKKDKDSSFYYKELLQNYFDDILYEKYLYSYVKEHALDSIAKNFMKTSFHYELEFPEIFLTNKKAFSILIGNPPWDKMKLENALFIGQFHPLYRKLLNSQKQNIMDAQEDEKIQQKSKLLALYSLTNHFYKERYPLSRGSGDDNLFRYFIEKALSEEECTVKEGGNVTLLIPTAFLTEDSSSTLRKYCLENFFLRFCLGFENRMKLFPKVDMRYKFALIQFIYSPQQAHIPSKIQFMEHSTDILQNPFKKTLSLLPEEISLLSPKHKALFEVSHKNDIALLKRIFSEIPLLQESFLSFKRELDCAFNKNLFFEEKTEHASIPLYKGAMIWQYNSAYAPAQYYLSPSTLDNFLQSREIHRFINDIYRCIPEKEKKTRRYYTKIQATLNFLQKTKADILEYIIPERLHWRFALRAIARNTDERSVIAALLPFGATYQNSLFTSSSKSYTFKDGDIIYKKTPLSLILYSMSICNSLIFDWLMRSISSMNIGKSHMYRLPFPQPNLLQLESTPYRKLIDNSLRLSIAKNPSAHIAILKEYPHTLIIPCSAREEEELQIENDILAAKLYNISRKELVHILSKKYFAVLWKKKQDYIEKFLDSY